MELLTWLGPQFGYFPEPDKLILIVNGRHEKAVHVGLSKFKFTFIRRPRYLGSYIGADGERGSWLDPKIQKWVKGIKVMKNEARCYPKIAYAGMTKSLKCEWQYLQRVLPNTLEVFKPI